MKIILTLFLVSLYLWVSNPVLNAVLVFEINHSEIIEKLCEGRFESVNKCQGMCYLKKKIEKADSKQIPVADFFQYELPMHHHIGNLSIVLPNRQVSALNCQSRWYQESRRTHPPTPPPRILA